MSDGRSNAEPSSATGEGTGPNGSNRLPVAEGAGAGLLAWVVGYAVTFLVVAPSIRDSPIHRVVEALDGEPATYEMVGWVFYNAHFVNTTFQGIPIFGDFTTTYVGGDGGYSSLLYLIPVVTLFLAGVLIARYRGTDDPGSGALIGVTVVPGYLIASIAGVILFEVTVGGANGAPDRVAGIVVAGIGYPLVVAGAGGALVGFVTDRTR